MMELIRIVVCIVGLLMYILAAKPKVSEVGRIMFWTGLLSLLLGALPALPHGT